MKTSRWIGVSLLPLLAIALSTGGGEARSRFKVIHSFAGGDDDGANPYGGVTPDGSGGFYVATDTGGIQNSGTLTHIGKRGAAQVSYSFLGNNDGQNADSTPLTYRSGVVWGTTTYGGAEGCGTIYAWATSGAYQSLPLGCAALHEFAFPFSALMFDGDNIWATAINGNRDGNGDNGGLYYVANPGYAQPRCELHGNDGAHPYAGATEARFVHGAQVFYIAASSGGSSNLGTIMQFDFSTDCNVRVLHNFGGGGDGANPYGTIAYDGGFFLYGTTRFGGGPNLGTVFKMDISGGNYTVLHTFQGICCGNSDGSFPFSGLTLNPKDKMYYGTTINGGGASDNGTIYKIDPNSGAETVAHAFKGRDGAHPYAGLYIDPKGRIYGTTLQGGANNLGVVFRLKT